MRVRNLPGTLCRVALTVAAIGAPARAAAQETGSAPADLALERFHPAPAGDRMFGVQSPYVAGDPALHVMVLADYAKEPLVLRREDQDEPTGAIVSDQLFFHMNVGLALWNRLLISADVPVALVNSGEGPAGGGTQFTAPSSAFGDVRLGLRLRLVGEYHDLFQLAVGGYAWLPTGSRDAYVSDGGVRGLPQLIAGGRGDRVVWSIAAGPELRPGQTFGNVSQGATLYGGGGFGILLGEDRRVQIGPEVSASTVLSDINRRTTNAEVLLGARARFLSFLEAGVAVGPGLTSGVGTPTFRAIGLVAFTPEQKKKEPPGDRDQDGFLDDVDACPDMKGVASSDPKKHGCPPPSDRDKDGFLDDVDACPDAKGIASDNPKKHGCPPPSDRDKDGIFDDVDACPDVKGVADPDPKKNGCPLDKDGDTIPDAEDACPDIPGMKTQDPATNGCPGDTDGDTIRDDKDACPSEKGKPDPDPKKNGCPQGVRVTEGEIIILQQVQFDFGRSTIKAVSNTLLDEVAAVLSEHPEIAKVEVQGHTDNKGVPRFNKDLSQRRANAVKKALERRKIQAERLTAVGYGQDVPLADNSTDEGRAQNRRVEFKILEKKPK